MNDAATRIMRCARSVWRSLHLLLLLVAATIDGRFVTRPRRGAQGAIWIHGWCRRFVAAIGLDYTVTGEVPCGGAVVSNHLSYLDILLYSAITPFVMVAKSEVQGWPLLGWLTARAGTVYVQRSEDVTPGAPRQSHAEVNHRMAEAYASGLPVLFFPEGTTTGGDSVLPFRRGLFHSVLEGGVPLRAAALRFDLPRQGNGDVSVADEVCFVGDALLGPHLFGCVGLRGLQARVHFGSIIEARADRFELSATARAAVMRIGDELRFAAHVAGDHADCAVEWIHAGPLQS